MIPEEVLHDRVLFAQFFARSEDDPRIATRHVSLYMALLYRWACSQFEMPLRIYRREIIDLCKLSGSSTYHQTILDLHAFGYIRYEPSFDHNKRSKIYIELKSECWQNAKETIEDRK